ncbi:cholinesterase 1-like [Aricia agestis]|uniref:cholinesterase 1-like n=1 Tax=Aricia agestis TaxID=91739 RepID=UPI001C2071EA|nr:cholinesterase 1-like [Aricia agestis]XP_041973806.1 cholinesterase 1-like [Aricia agestis]
MRWLILFVLFTCVCTNELPSRLVKTAQGPVRGYKDPDYDVFTFHNIPYATVPSGVDRFKAPLPPPVWEEPFEAAAGHQIICPQSNSFDFLPDTTRVEENCLIANVYVPDGVVELLPVVVYVHGGAFAIGYGDMIDPREMVNSKKILLVTFNYRLGFHGFLCLGTEAAPGNAGMKDQVALLRWVQKNIANFGGNPKDVTIVGSSAGAGSVDLLMVSKMARGLFNKVIPESGANTASFAVHIDPIESAKSYAELVNADIDVNDIYALEEFFIKTPLQDLNIINMTKNDSTVATSPCVERNIGVEMFLTESPYDILKKGDYEKLPMLYGFTNMEGLMRIFFNRGLVVPDLEYMNKNFSSYLPANLQFKNEKERNEVMERIKTHYFGTVVDEEDILDYVDYFSDGFFVQPTLMSVKLQVEAGNDQIYLYEYSFTDANDPTSSVPFTKVRGAYHCAQSQVVWGSTLNVDYFSFNKSEAYENHRKIIQKLWLNFITTGNPTPEGSGLPEWPAVGRKWSPHMSLGRAVELRGSLLKERALFWEDIYARHYRSPQPPPTPPPKRTEL